MSYRFPSHDPEPLYSFTSESLGKPTVSRNGWSVYSSKRPIMTADEIDRATARIGIPMPEMIFGKNYIVVAHESGWSLGFNAVDALDLVVKHGNPEGGLVKVAYSEAWMNDKKKTSDEVHQVVKPFDWTYTTSYQGTPAPSKVTWEPTSQSIPLDKLRRPDPILFFEEVVLFEDELGDNGIAMAEVKVRVMEERLLLLCRLFVRVDDVLFRIRDTRLFIEFEDNTILREYTVKQDSYENVKRKIPHSARDSGLFLRDANWIAEKMPVIQTVTEKSALSSS
ncbi:TIP41-like family-domain-containing protein [Myxozyma melibiosi]|uniref:TIP41-like family-domain-containing protein n=1 Tax=Myxozyma melibiosi TaxID=54550 RepID=A0ABR1F293_9ASCO